jgi:serine protease Do
VQLQALTPELAQSLHVSDTKGALVAAVTTGSPAAAAGMQRGDVIVAYDGKDVADMAMLPALVAATPIDRTVAVTVLRNGSPQALSVTVGRMPGERPEVASRNGTPAAPQGKWGLALRDLDPQTARQVGVAPGEGVLVAAVTPDSPAEQAGIRPGDVLLEVNRTKVASAAEAQAQAKSADGPLLVLVKRGDASLFAALEPK